MVPRTNSISMRGSLMSSSLASARHPCTESNSFGKSASPASIERHQSLLLSDDQSPGALSRGFEAGASFFAYKPIDKAHLKRLIHVTQRTIEHERRRFRRVPLRVKVRIKSDKAVLLGETIDISMNGALVSSPQTLPLGSLIEISLYPLGGSRPIVGLGSVARILNNTQMGLLLDRFPASEIVRLQEYLIPQIAD